MADGLLAHGCEDGHYTHPPHPRCPTCGAPQTDAVDLADERGTVVTWTVSRAPPPGVRDPNPVAIVAFEIEADEVRVIGQLTTADGVGTGDAVEPVAVEELREPGAGIREPASQDWNGYRFEPL